MTDFARASTLSGYREFAISQKLNPAELLKEVGLPADVLEQPESLISYRKFAKLLDISSQRSGNTLFGLQYGLFQGVSVFGPILYLLRNANNVGEALQELGLYFHLHSAAAEVKLEVQGSRVLLIYSIEEHSFHGLRHAVELALGVGAELMRTLIGNRWQAIGAMMQHAPASDMQAYRRLLGTSPQFNSVHNAWVFDQSLLQIPLSSADEALHRLMQQHLAHLDQMSIKELPSYVRQLLRSLLPGGRVTIEQIADYMMLSTRTLQRYLSDEGTSFQTLLDETRQSMAERYLRDATVNLTQLANLLGYSDLSAFSRAFQRWFGQSPREWKRQNTDASKRPRVRIRKPTTERWPIASKPAIATPPARTR